MPNAEGTDDAGFEDTMPLGEGTREVLPESAHPRIGPYRLLELIGEGGMGEVWLAEQLEPVRRKVAFKLIKAGMDTRQVVARFEAERQALALMEHPAIAKVFDAGATPEGRLFFVMEYVPGLQITDHCDEHHLSTERRLELFMAVCEAVQHAHHKAIIHRDLKPSNILIASVDGRSLPKIIDFGIAKATGHRLTDRTLHTEHGAVIGTPEYMSPEQADLGGGDVDTRTDVYSLGVILYQLLTSELPFGSQELRAASYEEMRRKIREEDPPRPSIRIELASERAITAARNREADPRTLKRRIAGDLDAIVMKALEKDRERRYATPSELAMDIGRHLRSEPVLARRPSAWYRARKYIRRHRLGVGIGAMLLSVLVLFAVTVSAQFRRIAAERDRANAERDRANTWFQHAREFVPKPRHDHTEGMKGEVPEIARTLDALLWKARAELDEGQFSDANKLLEDILHFERTTGAGYFADWTIGQLAEARMELGQLESARSLLERQREASRASKPDGSPDAYLTWMLARVVTRMGNPESALKLVEPIDDEPLHQALTLPMYAKLERLQETPEIKALRRDARIDAIIRFDGEQRRLEGLLARSGLLPPFSPSMKEVLGKLEREDSRLRWISAYVPHGAPPFDTGPSTKEGERTMEVCRALYTSESADGRSHPVLVIGKTWAGRGKCAIPVAGFELYAERFERLLGSAGIWKPGARHSYPAHSVIGGFSENGTPYLVCQGKTSEDAAHPGTLPADGRSNCRFGFGFREVERDTYFVLTTDDPSVPNTGNRSRMPD